MRAELTTTEYPATPAAAFGLAAGPPHAPPSPPSRRRPAPAQRSTGDRLREALLGLGDFHGQVVNHTQRAWASITFAGARHTLTLVFAGGPAVAAGEGFIAALPDHEFALPGQIVADAAVVEAEHRLLPNPRLVVTCELLLLEEG